MDIRISSRTRSSNKPRSGQLMVTYKEVGNKNHGTWVMDSNGSWQSNMLTSSILAITFCHLGFRIQDRCLISLNVYLFPISFSLSNCQILKLQKKGRERSYQPPSRHAPDESAHRSIGNTTPWRWEMIWFPVDHWTLQLEGFCNLHSRESGSLKWLYCWGVRILTVTELLVKSHWNAIRNPHRKFPFPKSTWARGRVMDFTPFVRLRLSLNIIGLATGF